MDYSTRPQYRIIDTDAELAGVSEALCRSKTVAVDLESNSMHRYREKVCLIQMATTDRCFVIDPLQLNDIFALNAVLSNPDILKVFHGADYDVRSLYRDFRITINNLFDTELASRFLGIRETGLESVLSQRFDIRLDKKYQKKDWSLRPLPDVMIEYAARDVQFLLPLAELLQEELRQKKRYTWVEEECGYLSKVRPADNTQPLYLKFRGSGRLEPRSLAILEALLQLRERLAAEKDRPPYMIFRNESLKKMATLKTTQIDDLVRERILSRRQVERYGNAVVWAIRSALRMSETRLPSYPHRKKPGIDSMTRKRIKDLRKWRDAKAENLQLNPAIVFNKAQLTAIAQTNPLNTEALMDMDELKRWQRQVFGMEIVHLLSNHQKAPGHRSL